MKKEFVMTLLMKILDAAASFSYREWETKMKKIILALFILLFCFSVGMAQELSKADKKESDEVLKSKGLLGEPALRTLVRQDLEIVKLKAEIEKFKSENKELRKAAWRNFSRWVEDRNSRKLKGASLKRLEEENMKLKYLIWELDAAVSDIRIEKSEIELLRTSYIFMPYFYDNHWSYPSSKQYFTTPNWTNYFWLNYYRRR
ncbi:MAG: hypothetical protein E3J76_04850 [Candidatus Aminicenantes bacterium]|nr:MAG: hypothetical protein E3J76_04850 [Candidatus Aminicenantes bacterium]